MDESRSGLLVSAYAVVVAVCSILLTAVVARWPRRPVLGGLLAGYAVSNALFAWTSSYGVALAARILGGLAHAGLFSVVFAAAVSAVPPSRAGRAVTFVSAGNAVGLAVGVPLGTAVGSAVGLRVTFAAAAALMAVLAVLILVVLPRAAPPAATTADPVLSAVRRGPLLIVAVIVVCTTLGHYTPYTYVTPAILAAGVGPGRVSVVLFGYGAAGVVGLTLAGVVVDRHPVRGLQTAVALTAASVFAVGLAHASTAATVSAVVVWGAAFGALPTLLVTAALRAAPDSPDAAPAVVTPRSHRDRRRRPRRRPRAPPRRPVRTRLHRRRCPHGRARRPPDPPRHYRAAAVGGEVQLTRGAFDRAGLRAPAPRPGRRVPTAATRVLCAPARCGWSGCVLPSVRPAASVRRADSSW